jgi:hypothetical protein
MSSSIPIKDFIMVALDEEEAQNGWPENMKPKDEIAQVLCHFVPTEHNLKSIDTNFVHPLPISP